MKRSRIVLGVIAVGAGLAYLASPFLVAFEVRQAMKTGDKATLERRVDWEPVRASLKASISEIQRKATLDNEIAGAPRASIWSRVKAMVMPTVAESFVDSYVTAEGVIQLFAARNTLKSIKSGITGDAASTASTAPQDGQDAASPVETLDQGSALDRMSAFYSRIQRAEFLSPTAVEFEIADRNTPGRRFISTFELKSLAWKLTGVKVAGVGF
jgi:hypothetical protein